MSGNTVRTLVTGLLLVSLVSKLPTDAFAQSPQNSVVMVGGQTMFTCDFGLASWDLSRDGSSNALFIAKDCVIAPGFSSNYLTEKSTNSCELIVINVTMQHAGVYTCNNTAEGIAKRAVLTVIEIPAEAETNVSGNVTEGESLVLNCSIKYNGSVAPASILRPKLHWAEINTRSYYSNPNEAVSKATFRVGRQDKLQFTCRVYFLLTLDTSNSTTYAPNTPSKIYIVRTVRMDVYHGPGNLTIYENDRNGDRIVVELNCSSSANPPADYKWTDVTNGTDKKVVSNTSTYSEAERNRVYECTAYNYIRGRRHEASTNYTVPPSNYTVPPIKYTSVPNNPIPNSTVPRISSTSAPNNTIPNSTVAVPTFSPNPSTEVSSIQVSDSAKISTAKASAIQFSDTTKISTGLGWTRNPVGQQETAGQSTSWSLGGNNVPGYSCPAETVTIVVSVLLAISVAVNMIQLIWYKRNSSKGSVDNGIVREEEVVDDSNTFQHPASYEQLNPNTINRISGVYEELQRGAANN